jgi:hypothetical protein
MRVLAKDGRVAKTIYLLEYVNSEVYRRRIHTQFNRGESGGQLARVVYNGNRGEVREKSRPGMVDQLGALGFVVNAIACWNSGYMLDESAKGSDLRPLRDSGSLGVLDSIWKDSMQLRFNRSPCTSLVLTDFTTLLLFGTRPARHTVLRNARDGLKTPPTLY